MIDLETAVQSMPDHEAFTRACCDVFSTAPGQLMLMTLVKLAHPVKSPLMPTPEETHVRIGQKEVVALLWGRQNINDWVKT